MKKLIAKRRNRPRTSNPLPLRTRHRSSLSVTSSRWWLQVLGLKASSRIPDKLPREESLGFVVGDVEVLAVAPVAVGQAQLLPSLGCVDSALELFRVDEGLNDKDWMAVGGLPVGAETLQGEAKDS